MFKLSIIGYGSIVKSTDTKHNKSISIQHILQTQKLKEFHNNTNRYRYYRTFKRHLPHNSKWDSQSSWCICWNKKGQLDNKIYSYRPYIV